MRFYITQLNFRKDPDFDPDNVIEKKFAEPFLIQYKRHWWSCKRFVMDKTTHCPRLFYGIDSVHNFIHKFNLLSK